MQNIDSTSQKLFRLVRLLTRYNHLQERDGGTLEQSRGQGRVLALLELKPGITQTELSYLLGVRNQSLGEMLAKLERNELIKREASSEDKRVQNITLTDKGKDAAKNIKKNDGDKIFEILSSAEEQSFSAVLDKLIEELEKVLGKDADGDMDMRPRMPLPHMPRIRVMKKHIKNSGDDDIEIDFDDMDNGDGAPIKIIKKQIRKSDGDVEIDIAKELADMDGFEEFEGGAVKIIDNRASDGTGIVKKIIIKKDKEEV